MQMLVANAGSSSLKVSVIGDDDVTRATTELGNPMSAGVDDALIEFAGTLGDDIAAAGHRFVHGGPELRTTALVNDRVRLQLGAAAEIAPLHVPAALHVLDLLRSRLNVPHVACFDTAFHTSMPPAASTYAVPPRWRERYGMRRYGFHGLSCVWSLRRAAEMLRRDPHELQLVIAHLGAGASVTAVRNAGSVDTTMGFTPLEGLVMATRSGSVDPGALLWLQAARGMSFAEVSDELEHASGLRGLAGTADMREVLQRASHRDSAAQLARDVYVHRASALTAAMAASLDRIDALIFTGGVGENASEIVVAICSRLRTLGVPRVGAFRGGEDSVISTEQSAVAVLVIHAREDLAIAHEVRQLLMAPRTVPSAHSGTAR